MIGLGLMVAMIGFFLKRALGSEQRFLLIAILILMMGGSSVMSSVRYFLPLFGFLAAIYHFSGNENPQEKSVL